MHNNNTAGSLLAPCGSHAAVSNQHGHVTGRMKATNRHNLWHLVPRQQLGELVHDRGQRDSHHQTAVKNLGKDQEGPNRQALGKCQKVHQIDKQPQGQGDDGSHQGKGSI
eukprot:6920388-Ditylum_brightwellii.AAC.1